MCTELLPPGGYPIAVTYIISYHTLSYHNCIYNCPMHLWLLMTLMWWKNIF